jgi:hypothetical protein
MTAEKQVDTFNVTFTLPIQLRTIYRKLRKNKKLALGSFIVNKLCEEYPEVEAALAEKGEN